MTSLALPLALAMLLTAHSGPDTGSAEAILSRYRAKLGTPQRLAARASLTVRGTSSWAAEGMDGAGAMGFDATFGTAHRGSGFRHVQFLPVTQQKRFALTRRQLRQRLLHQRQNLRLLELADGVLTIKIPRQDRAKPRRIEIGGSAPPQLEGG